MLSLKEILPYYTEALWVHREFILREYLQYKILQIIFDIPGYDEKLCFLGGTALRIVHGNLRFSEDLDFDNSSLTEDNFDTVSEAIKRQLIREGYEVEIKAVYRGHFIVTSVFQDYFSTKVLPGISRKKSSSNWIPSHSTIHLLLISTY